MAILACDSDTESGRVVRRRGLVGAHKTQDSYLVANRKKEQVTEDQLGIGLNTLMDFGVPLRILPPNATVRDAVDFVLQAEQEHEVSMIV